jgi:hypothetical protein
MASHSSHCAGSDVLKLNRMAEIADGEPVDFTLTPSRDGPGR